MALLKFKRSAVPAKVPALNDLALGELAINTYDGKVYTKKDDGTPAIVQVGGGGGVQTISSADGSVTITGTTDINLSVPVTAATNTVLLPVRNNTGSVLAKGTAVYINGALGQNPTVTKAIATGDATSAQTLGLVTANINNNAVGNITLIGSLTNLDTSAYSDGQQLYLSPTTAGALTATKPYAPNHLVYMAVVEHAHPSLGKLFVKVQNGYEMDELHDVSAQSPSNNDGLFFNTSTSLWEKKSIVTALGYTPANKAGDTFTGTVNFGGGSKVDANGDIYARRNGGTTGVYYFAAGVDKYLYWDGSQYIFSNAGAVTGTIFSASSAMYSPIFYDSNNTGYYVDLTGSTSINAGGSILASGNLVLNNGANRYVRIGSATNYSYDLQTTGDDFQIIEAGTTPRLTIKYPNGYVGIGTTLPRGNLSIGTASASSTTLAIHLGYTSADYYGFRVTNVSNAALLYAGSFSIQRGTGSAWSDALSISNAGNTTANVDMRAPIFYDSDNTAYYVDPASTGISAVFAGDININAGYEDNRALRFREGSTDIYGAFVKYTAGDSLELGTRNNSTTDTRAIYISRGANWAGSDGSFRAPIFYDSENTGFYGDFASTSVMADAVIGGRTMSTAMHYAGFTLDANTMPSNSTGFTYAVNAPFVGPIVRAGQPAGGAYDLWLNAPYGGGDRFAFRTRNGDTAALNSWQYPALYNVNANGGGSLYATIYYDQNNTGYYVDPASGSRLGGQILFDGLSNVASNGDITSRRSNGATGVYYFSDGGSKYLFWDGGQYLFGNAGPVIASGTSFRAPIFYDSDNTSFYLDPASTGDALIAAGNGAFGISYSKARITARRDTSGTTPADSASIVLSNRSTAINGTLAGGIFMDTFRDIRDPHYAGGIWFTRNQTSGNLASGSDIVFGAMENWDTGLPTERMRIYATGPVLATSDFRAPVFYDNSNTAYYVDPVNGTVLNRLVSIIGAGNSSGGNLQLGDKTESTAKWSVMTGAHYNGVSQAKGITLVASYGSATGNEISIGGNIYEANPATYIAFYTATSITHPTGGSNRLSINGDGNVTANVDIRAPIYYDSGNTAYYVDPASSTALFSDGVVVAGTQGFQSRVYTVGARNRIWSFNNADGYGISYFQGTAGTISADTIGFHFGTATAAASTLQVIGNNYTLSLGSMRSPLFYDSDNTGYYLDASSTGTSLNVAGSIIAAGNVTAYSDIRIKANVETIAGALGKLDQIRGVTYTRTDLDDKQQRYAGVIAQEIEAVLPEAVRDLGNIKAIDYNATIALLIEAVKELTLKVKTLEEKDN